MEQIGNNVGLTISCSSTSDTTSTTGSALDPPSKATTTDTVWSDTTTNQKRRQDLATQGFTLIDEAAVSQEYSTLVSKLRKGILVLEQEWHLPATFIFLFDQAWSLAWYSQQLFQHACHPKNQFNFDVLAWYIGPGQSGFSPHRDRQPVHVSSSFHDYTGSGGGDTENLTPEPKFVTHWIALSHATPSNSCLYVIPKDSDPGYLAGDDDNDGTASARNDKKEKDDACSDPLQRALPDKTAYQKIRALSRESGQSLLFTHRLIHWGSQSWETDVHKSRIAISFVCSDPEYEAPFLKEASWRKDSPVTPAAANDILRLPFRLRLLLVCAQLICYHERFEPSKATIKACYDYCKEHEHELGEAYRQKVFLEFIKAMEERKRIEAANANSRVLEVDKKLALPHSKTNKDAGGSNGKVDEDDNDKDDNDDNDDDDEDEAMMEEMLNAEKEGYGEFEDDFDAMDGDANVDNESEGKYDDDDDDDDDEDDEEEEVDIFGKRGLEQEDSKISKKVKRALQGES